MRLHRTADAATFLQMAGDFLTEREAERNLALSIARECIDDPGRYPGPNYFAAVEGAHGIEGVALMTPPYRVQVVVEPGPAITLVVDDLAGAEWHVSGVTGPEATTKAFATAWAEQCGARLASRRRLRAFELTVVTQAPLVPGEFRLAGPGDLPIIETWYRAFEAEADPSVGEPRAAELGARALHAGRVFLWDHNRPVSQAAITGTTPRGVRIGMVYTPPEHRRRGYATALVGALSQRCLADGRSFCCLFTDLANPVSNAIYPRVGYRPVTDFEEIDFAAAV
jgi:predicted GNAT family acetyltransferase